MKAKDALTGQRIRWTNAAGWVFEGVVNHTVSYGIGLAAFTCVTPTTVATPASGARPYQGCDVLVPAETDVDLVAEA